MRPMGEQSEGDTSSKLTAEGELEKLSPEALATRERVEAGRAAEGELRRMNHEKDMLRRTIRDHLDVLREALGQEGDIFERMSAETARLLQLYRQRADESSRQDQAFIGGIEDYLHDLTASREAEERLRGQA